MGQYRIKFIVPLIGLTILVVIAVLAHRKWSKEQKEVSEIGIQWIKMSLEWDLEELRERPDRIIAGIHKADND